jgi:hypothetical protein
MVNIRVGMTEKPPPPIGVKDKILQHIFVNFFLQIDSYCAVTANDLIGAYAGVGRNIPSRIRNSNVPRHVANRMVRPLDGSGNEPPGEFLM